MLQFNPPGSGKPPLTWRAKNEVQVGDCLKRNNDGRIFRVFYIAKMTYSSGETLTWLYCRDSSGEREIIPPDYIPYSYLKVECGSISIPPPPQLSLGDTVKWTVAVKGKTLHHQGIITRINDLNQEADIMVPEKFGVPGYTSVDLYELTKVE